jgi:general stress protein YciG
MGAWGGILAACSAPIVARARIVQSRSDPVNVEKRDPEKGQKSEPMSVRDAGRKGGRATRARYGPEFFAEIGQKGGKAVSQRYPSEHFQEIGRKGGRRVAELVERAKQLEVEEG